MNILLKLFFVLYSITTLISTVYGNKFAPIYFLLVLIYYELRLGRK